MNILNICWCTLYNVWMQYGRLYPYDYPVFMANLFLTGYLSLYLLEILVLVYLITNNQALLMFTLLLPMLCLFLLLFVFYKHYGKKTSNRHC